VCARRLEFVGRARRAVRSDLGDGATCMEGEGDRDGLHVLILKIASRTENAVVLLDAPILVSCLRACGFSV
jgi:hypothetical protein